jgi:hypothetical protein
MLEIKDGLLFLMENGATEHMLYLRLFEFKESLVRVNNYKLEVFRRYRNDSSG